ncbi:MAG: hypothetical protein CME62_13225 [Halobacteriovoraceae bacterium]|nr:hypothetical protein [Halobacteriovoraceae bacterium]|tara:strand:- start:1575 stop:2009 length:435 start_codon:yes stop_codon:yes gene_type:complete
MNFVDKLFVLAVFAQLSFYPVVLFIMFRRRVAAIKSKEVPFKYFSSYQMDKANLPEPMVICSNHFNNLFQIPLLFLITGLLILTLKLVTWPMVVLAWLFVFLRLIHSLIHLGSNNIIQRMRAFGSSTLVLLVMWLYLIGKIFLS